MVSEKELIEIKIIDFIIIYQALNYLCALFLKMRIKKIILFLVVLTGYGAKAQYNNAIRVNVAGLPVNLYSVQLEHTFGNFIAFNNTIFYRPKLKVPFGKGIDKIAKNEGVGLTGIKFQYIFMDEAQLGMKGYSPELKFYLKKEGHRPFISLFGIYDQFDMQVPTLIFVKGFDVKVPVNFKFETLSGGILFGYQFQWNRVGLDLVIGGPHIGKGRKFYAEGHNPAIKGLSEEEKQDVKDGILNRFGLSDKYFKLEITDESAEIKSIRPIPYIGLRGLGLNFSYRF